MTDGYRLQNVSYAYEEQSPVLRDLNLVIQPGEFYGIVGPNGCGKTTFLDLLVGGREPDRGEIYLDDRLLNSYPRRELARRVALVPQDFAIGFAFPVAEVVLMGRHPYINRFGLPAAHDRELARQAMEFIGISDFAGRKVNELSGGEKQRVVVARALAQDTRILLFDEATSNLDVRFTLQIFNLARQLVREKGRTVIAVIHNLNLAAAYCRELIFMKQGKIVCNGPIDQVLKSEIIEDVFGVEANIAIDPFSRTRQVSYRYWSD